MDVFDIWRRYRYGLYIVPTSYRFRKYDIDLSLTKSFRTQGLSSVMLMARCPDIDAENRH